METKTVFTRTQSVLTFMKTLGATSFDTKPSKSGNSRWLVFNDKEGTTSMLSGPVKNAQGANLVDASNIRDLVVSWIEGINKDTGKAVSGWSVHNKGNVESIATFSLADLEEEITV